MSNFYNILSTLTKEEVKEYEKHLKSNFKASAVPLKIATYFLSLHKKDIAISDLKTVAKKIFKKTGTPKANLTKLRNGLSDLFLDLKEFLINEKFKLKEFERDLLWIEILDEKKLEHKRLLFEKKINKRINNAAVENIWFKVNTLRYYHFIFFRNNFKKDNPQTKSLEYGLRSLEEFYSTMKIKILAEMVNRQNLVNESETNFDLPAELLKLKQGISFPLSKNGELYYRLLQMLENNSNTDFQELRKYLEKNESSLHQDEKLTILIYLINYLSAGIKSGSQRAIKKAINIYAFGLDKKILIYKDKMDETIFINIITLACKIGEFDWIKDFIKKNKENLPQATLEQTLCVAQMIISFKQRNFVKTIKIIRKEKIKNIFLHISSRIHLLASLYETKNEDLENSMDTFYKFLNQNKKIGKNIKTAALNFNKMLRYLFGKKISKKMLQDEMNACKEVYFRKWLDDKISQYQPI